METIVDRLEAFAQLEPSKELYRFFDKDLSYQIITYKDLYESARLMASAISSFDRPIPIVLPKSFQFIAAFFGCLMAGKIAVPVAMPNRSDLKRLMSIVENSGSRHVIANKVVLEAVAKQKGQNERRDQVQWIDIEELLSQDGYYNDSFSSEAHEVAFLQYTSGSTGDPKGVVVTHKNLMNNLSIIKEALRTQSDDIDVSWLPHYHDMGLISGMLQPVFCGSSSYLINPIDFIVKPKIWFEIISKYKATTTGAPNFAFDLVCDRADEEWVETIDLSSIKAFYCGAEPINPTTIKRFEKYFSEAGVTKHQIAPCYGLAENTLVVTTKPIDDSVKVSRGADGKNRVSLGKPYNDTQVKIVNNETGNELPEGQIGEIWVHGSSVASGYWNNEVASEYTFVNELNGLDHHMRSGDLGYLKDGELFYVGRVKHTIIVNGIKYFPEDIEMSLASVDEVISNGVLVYAIEDNYKDQVSVIAELKDINKKSENELHALETVIRRKIFKEFGIALHSVQLVRKRTISKTTSGKNDRAGTMNKLIDN